MLCLRYHVGPKIGIVNIEIENPLKFQALVVLEQSAKVVGPIKVGFSSSLAKR